MVPDCIRPREHFKTGLTRARLAKAWFGIRVIVEEEFLVDYACTPYGPALRTEHEWREVNSLWEFIGRNFYAEVQ